MKSVSSFEIGSKHKIRHLNRNHDVTIIAIFFGWAGIQIQRKKEDGSPLKEIHSKFPTVRYLMFDQDKNEMTFPEKDLMKRIEARIDFEKAEIEKAKEGEDK